MHFIPPDAAWDLRGDRPQRLRHHFVRRPDRRRRPPRPALTLVEPFPSSSATQSHAA